MKRLYEKNELTFAIICIVVYVAVFGTMRANFGDNSVFSFLAALVFAAALAVFVTKNNLRSKYGLTNWPKAGEYLYFIPLILMVTVNLWNGAAINFPGAGQLYALCTMGLAGFIEEVIFRGLLFRAMEKESVKRAIIISAVTFGVGHIVNLLTDHAGFDTALQVCYAVAIGFAFVMLFYKSGSLLPCIVTHSLINMTSVFCNTPSSEEKELLMNICGSVFLIIVAGGYALYLRKKE